MLRNVLSFQRYSARLKRVDEINLRFPERFSSIFFTNSGCSKIGLDAWIFTLQGKAIRIGFQRIQWKGSSRFPWKLPLNVFRLKFRHWKSWSSWIRPFDLYRANSFLPSFYEGSSSKYRIFDSSARITFIWEPADGFISTEARIFCQLFDARCETTFKTEPTILKMSYFYLRCFFWKFSKFFLFFKLEIPL